MRDFKKHTSKAIIDAIANNIQESRRDWMLNMFGYAGRNNNSNENFQFWQQDYHPVALDTAEKTYLPAREPGESGHCMGSAAV